MYIARGLDPNTPSTQTTEEEEGEKQEGSNDEEVVGARIAHAVAATVARALLPHPMWARRLDLRPSRRGCH